MVPPCGWLQCEAYALGVSRTHRYEALQSAQWLYTAKGFPSGGRTAGQTLAGVQGRKLRPGKASQPRAAGLVPAALALGVETSPGPLGSLESSEEGEGDPRAEPVTPHRPSGPACLSCPHKNGD